MDPEKSRQEQALDALLAVAFGGRPNKDVNITTVLAALTPEERAALRDPIKRATFLNPTPTARPMRNAEDADRGSS
jgi:hypothetical protein